VGSCDGKTPRRALVALPCFCAQERAAFTGVAFGNGERRTKQPAGARARCARVRRQRMDALSANFGRRSRTRWAWGALSLGHFSLGGKEK